MTSNSSGTSAPDLPTDLADRIEPAKLLSSQTSFAGHVWDVRTDVVDLGGDGGTVTRDYVRHPGAVGIVALRGGPGSEQVLLIRQYRHPVRALEWELPAGLLDVEGEPPQEAASRELAEEAHLGARQWHVLVDMFSTPGGSSEAIRVFLARDVFDAVAEGFVRQGEEAGMSCGWLGLDAAVTAALEGRLHNSLLIAGVLAAAAARSRDWSTLRAADAGWPEHPSHR
ncbi:NUDIX domain-containing protein [Branchiibius cervicis]|uniref:NUDIX domain-containing protein n=1 Tax=Branchiibius cervicis TaxID=908252 RepID=A0ABW2ASQ9_9MICO